MLDLLQTEQHQNLSPALIERLRALPMIVPRLRARLRPAIWLLQTFGHSETFQLPSVLLQHCGYGKNRLWYSGSGINALIRLTVGVPEPISATQLS